MKVAEIYYFESNQVIGRDTRNKYHVYMGDGSYPFSGAVFLFINKSNLGEGYKIFKKDYSFLTYQDSYIDCSSVVDYPPYYFRGLKIIKAGTLSKRHVAELYNAIAKSDTMEEDEIKFVCNSLKPLL